MNIEVTNYSGGLNHYSPEYLPRISGLTFKTKVNVGYHNEIRIYPNEYKSNNEVAPSAIDKGTFLNDSLIFGNFNQVPILIDNYKLALDNSAHSRQLSEDKLLTNRISNIADVNGSPVDKIFNSASLLTNLSVTDIAGKATDEYEFYRSQKAEFADKAISAPSITSQTTDNNFTIANKIFGVTVKISNIDSSEVGRLKKYYNTFGFEWNEIGNIDDVFSMDKMNFVKFSGNWNIPNVDTNMMEIIKATFENGVKLWHDNDTPNPFNQDITNNKRIK